MSWTRTNVVNLTTTIPEDSLVPVRKNRKYAIPRRKVKLDNKVCHFPLFTDQPILF